MSLFELLDQPFNVVHELYRIVYLKSKLQKEKDEREKLEAEEKARQEALAHREQIRNNVPAFATKNEVLKQTPPQNKPENIDKHDPSMALASQMISSDMQDVLEEVIS